jgi:hypothetical protein
MLSGWEQPDALGASGQYVFVVRERMLQEPELDGLLDAVSRARHLVASLIEARRA